MLREAERGDKMLGVLCRDHGVSEQGFYRWTSAILDGLVQPRLPDLPGHRRTSRQRVDVVSFRAVSGRGSACTWDRVLLTFE